jgi:hypothetical protein
VYQARLFTSSYKHLFEKLVCPVCTKLTDDGSIGGRKLIRPGVMQQRVATRMGGGVLPESVKLLYLGRCIAVRLMYQRCCVGD